MKIPLFNKSNAYELYLEDEKIIFNLEQICSLKIEKKHDILGLIFFFFVCYRCIYFDFFFL